jgi:LPXTG-motif cell wall-anchored protein
MKIRRACALVALAVCTVLAVGAPAYAATSVSIVDFSFQPGSVTISAGDSVVWTNTGAAPHTVTDDNGAFDSSPNCPNSLSDCMQPGDSYTHTFSSAGTFDYHCKVHPNMTGTVVVEAAETSPGPTTSSSGSPLPNTGAGPLTGPFVAFGLLFLVAGAVVLFRLRRRASA